MSTLYLCGVGNGEGIRLALQVNQRQQRWQQVLLLDDDASKHGTERMGLRVVGGFDKLGQANPATDQVVNLVTRTTAGRAKARARIASFGIPFASLVHPDVDLLGVTLGEEVTVYAGAYLGAEARLARSSVALVGAIIGHGAQLQEGVVVAPNAVINARVKIGAQAYVGANATVLPDLEVGAGATIAANTLVLTDVPAGATALGVPATLMPAPGLDAEPATEIITTPGGQADGHADAGADSADLEATLSTAFARMLVLEVVPRQANFFDLGGTSLKAIQLCQLLRDEYRLQVQTLDLFQYPSVARLAIHLAGADSGGLLSAAQQRAAMRRGRGRR